MVFRLVRHDAKLRATRSDPCIINGYILGQLHLLPTLHDLNVIGKKV